LSLPVAPLAVISVVLFWVAKVAIFHSRLERQPVKDRYQPRLEEAPPDRSLPRTYL
jgi:hypothetical protein